MVRARGPAHAGSRISTSSRDATAGPTHSLPEKRRADIRKNRACWFAGLQLHRFHAAHVKPHQKHALVDFVFERFRDWNDPSAWTDLRGGEDEEDDPSIMFDLVRPLAPTRKLADHLLDKFNVQSNRVDVDRFDFSPYPREAETTLLEYRGSWSGEAEVFTRSLRLRRELLLVPAGRGYGGAVPLKSFEREVLYDWADRVFDNHRSVSPFPVWLKEPTPGLVEQVVLWRGTPGLSPEEMAYHFAEYLVFDDAANWVRSRPRSAWADPHGRASMPSPEARTSIRI